MPDLVVLDLGLPRLDGVEVCRRLRADSDVPILMLTARSETEDRVAGLDSGADDYLVKPFERDELLARIRALLRRRPPRGSASLEVADLALNPDTREVRRGEREIELTKREFELLEYLMRNQRLVVSRERLLDEVWGYDPLDETNTIDVFISNLRRKLEEGGEPASSTPSAAPATYSRRRRDSRISRLRPRNWPVRWRLAGASAGLTLVILVLFGAVIGNLAAPRIRDDFDGEMQPAVATLSSQIQVIDTIASTLIARHPDLGDFVSPNDATARIFDSHGAPARASPGAIELGAPVLGVHHVGDMRVVTVTLRSGQTGRVAGYVQYGRDEHHIDSTIDRLWLFIAAGVLGATLLAALAGLAIAGRAMRPISSLTATAREISDTGDPSRNMPAPKTDDEVGELAETLEEMLRSLDAARSEREAAMRKQREFVADASHELRTPLTSILANLELLQASLEDPTRGEDRAVVDSALRSSNRMSRLVADLLLLARADAGRPGAAPPATLPRWPATPRRRSRRPSANAS